MKLITKQGLCQYICVWIQRKQESNLKTVHQDQSFVKCKHHRILFWHHKSNGIRAFLLGGYISNCCWYLKQKKPKTEGGKAHLEKKEQKEGPPPHPRTHTHRDKAYMCILCVCVLGRGAGVHAILQVCVVCMLALLEKKIENISN